MPVTVPLSENTVPVNQKKGILGPSKKASTGTLLGTLTGTLLGTLTGTLLGTLAGTLLGTPLRGPGGGASGGLEGGEGKRQLGGEEGWPGA